MSTSIHSDLSGPPAYQADGLGSVTSLSNSSGTNVATYTFDSFGNLTASTGSLTNPFRYTARESDSETGLYYYRARYYDPSVGRFLSEDPIGFDGGANFYSYVKNDSPNYRDPTGLAMCVYHIQQHTMVCWPTGIGSAGNNTMLTLGPQGVDSGDPGSCRDNPECIYKHGGPIIPGNYKINPDLRPEHAGWPLFRLEPDPPVSKLDAALIKLNLKRGGFELHIGTRTHGCINAENGDPQAVKQFNAIYLLLKSENGNNHLLVLP